jgi:type VI secretion system protein ImpC
MAEAEGVQSQPEGATVEMGDFSALLKKEFKPKTDQAQAAVESAVKTLAEFVLKDTAVISDDAIKSIGATIAAIDRKLTEQINHILHHSDFQKLEGAWRGLHHLVTHT